MRRTLKSEGFNLAFLDIMSCGLGAVILIFLIIKHNVNNGSIEAEILLSEQQSLEQQQKELKTEIIKITKMNADEEALGETIAKQL
jgi:hypothetical protein